MSPPKIALITGAGSGIGRAVALGFAREGYQVVLAGRRAEPLEAVAQQGGPACVAMTADVTLPADVDVLFAGVQKRFGRLDVLFNNAGAAAPPTPFEDFPLTQWNKLIGTNLTGAFLVAQAAYRLMKAQDPRGGRIINNGSVAATVPRPRMAAYTASKHAISGLTKTIALEGRAHDIACGQIDIGNTATDIADAFALGTLQADLSIKPEPLFDVKHVTDAVLYMASLPLDVNVFSMTIMATKMPLMGRG